MLDIAVDHRSNDTGVSIASDLHRHTIDLQLHGRRRCTAPSARARYQSWRWCRTRLDYRRHKRRRSRRCRWQSQSLVFEPLPQIPPPRVQLRWIKPMSASNGADSLAPRIALRDNRDLHLRRPFPSRARARENLEPLCTSAHRIITRDNHSSSASPQVQRAKTRRYASNLQGGAGTALTLCRGFAGFNDGSFGRRWTFGLGRRSHRGAPFQFVSMRPM